jgi:RHH-type proline utilization regulon transcriptional repressor/proline dehydrogenase/delta 1-pyrroline-5-carboxylate dehydrogenase
MNYLPPPYPSFKNEPFTDFSEEPNRRAMVSALQEVEACRIKGEFVAKPIIDGIALETADTLARTDPSDLTATVGTTSLASPELTERAIAAMRDGFTKWRARPSDARIAAARRLAQSMRERKALLSALIVREAGKPWREADADVAEAIDFCDYYALVAERMAFPSLTESVLGEENLYLYQPRGVVAVISPWNFPLAITCGMAVAALVTGNTVVLKPAEQGSLIGHELARLILESGFPSYAFSFLPGLGETVGRALVQDPRVDMIVFTGSRPVGFEIIESAAKVQEGQRSVKRVVAELGGKNAIIVDEDADMDDAIRGVLASAFGYTGQKCSACSRLIVVGDAYEPFLDRLRAASKDLIIGKASDPSVALGPVIDEESHKRILSLIEAARKEIPLLVQAPVPDTLLGRGYFIPATIFRDVPTTHSLWREEIFGPVLSCCKARSFAEALKHATDSLYALTGGVFTRHPEHLALAREHFRVGNLYINRGITGALVGRQPFGGFGFSGIGSKAGGPDYLLQFVEPRVVTENTMRRGFTPDL